MSMADDDKVGYGKPPKKSRFKPGKSGNPRGRPKGTKNLKTDLQEELIERIAVRDSNGSRRITKQKALVKSIVAKAIKGDQKAAGIILDLVLRLLAGDEPIHDQSPLSADEEALMDKLKRRQLAGREDGGTQGELE
jgi:hypothetical protein